MSMREMKKKTVTYSALLLHDNQIQQLSTHIPRKYEFLVAMYQFGSAEFY